MTRDEDFTVDIWLLDAVLTGGDSRSGRGDTHLFLSLDEWVLYGPLFYLSDGGYSRVFSPTESGRICLSSESRDEVKERWDSYAAQGIRMRIEAQLKKRLQEMIDESTK